jgi:DNA-binding SARP family transcriptional activator
MPLYAGFFALEVMVGLAGLIAGYRTTPSRSFRRQILHLLVPTGLIVLAGILNWTIVFAGDADQIPHEWGSALLIAAGWSYARAVLRYGSLVGHPLDRRDLLYSIVGAATGLVILYLTTTFDRWLAVYTPLPFPVTTSLLVLVVAVGYPSISRWLTRRLDRLLFPAERRRREMIHYLTETLAEAADPEWLQVKLLRAVCAELNVRGGYVALPDPGSLPGTLTVCAVQGDISVRLGDPVREPPMGDRERLVVAGSLPREQEDAGWQDVALFCPLIIDRDHTGVLALGEKQDGRAFTQHELAFCGEMTKQLSIPRRMVGLRETRNGYIEAAHSRDQALRHLEEQVVAFARQALAALERHAVPSWNVPLEIRILGPMRVAREGQPVPEAAWGTEKAKALLAYLLWKGATGTTREELSMALWPGRPVDEAANVFHVTLHRLRQALEPELRRVRDSRYILHERRRYRFNFDAAHWLDVAAFQDLARESDVEALREAVALYRGSYLEDAGWDLPAEVEIQRRMLERLYADVLRRLIARSDDEGAMPYLEKLVSVEPAEEAAHRALVLGYLSRGRRDLARRQVARWREVVEELHLGPSRETSALWQMVEEDGAGRGSWQMQGMEPTDCG